MFVVKKKKRSDAEITCQDVHRALRIKQVTAAIATATKVNCTILLIALVAVFVAACTKSNIGDKLGELVTDTAAAVATVAPELKEEEPKETARPLYIMEEVISGDRRGLDGISEPPYYERPTEAAAEKMAQKMHDDWLESVPVDEIDCSSAQYCKAADFRELDPAIDPKIYIDIPYNMFCYDVEDFRTNREVEQEIGLDEMVKLCETAIYYAMTQSAIDPEYDADDFSDGSRLVDYFSEDYRHMLTLQRAEYHKKYDTLQDAVVTSDYSLVYKDGSGLYRVRTCVEIKPIQAGKAASHLHGYSDEMMGRWFWGVYDCQIQYTSDVTQPRKVKNVELIPITDLFEVVDPERIAYLERVA